MSTILFTLGCILGMAGSVMSSYHCSLLGASFVVFAGCHVIAEAIEGRR